jgi:hypothetical protein
MNQDGLTPNGEPSDVFIGTFDVALPDLHAASVTPDRVAVWLGESIGVAWTVQNIGGVSASGTWQDKV